MNNLPQCTHCKKNSYVKRKGRTTVARNSQTFYTERFYCFNCQCVFTQYSPIKNKNKTDEELGRYGATKKYTLSQLLDLIPTEDDIKLLVCPIPRKKKIHAAILDNIVLLCREPFIKNLLYRKYPILKDIIKEKLYEFGVAIE